MPERIWEFLKAELPKHAVRTVKAEFWNAGSSVSIHVSLRNKGNLDCPVSLHGRTNGTGGWDNQLEVHAPFRHLRIEPMKRGCRVRMEMRIGTAGSNWEAARDFLEAHFVPSVYIEVERAYSQWLIQRKQQQIRRAQEDLKVLAKALRGGR
jgi:hypothetical protein